MTGDEQVIAEPALQLQRVVKRFGDFCAVDDLSFAVRPGEIFGFLGPNGAGKTTTLRMILDIIQPTSGSIRILGAPSATSVRRRIGYLPEERGLYRKMRALDTIAYFAELRGVPSAAARSKARALLEEFGLGAFARSRNEALSKGMAQKVQLLATIAHEPDILILDEPFSGLDPINQATLESLIISLKAAGRTIIFSTHVMQHAERLCDRLIILAKGQKRFEGRLDEAQALFPPRIRLHSSATTEALAALPGVVRIVDADRQGEEGAERRIDLAPGADPQRFLKAAFEAGLALSSFDAAPASLHDIFVSLAGDEPVPGASLTEPGSRAEAAE